MSLRDDLIAAMQATAAEKPRAVKVPGWGTVYVHDVLISEVDTGGDGTAERLSQALGIPKDKIQLARGAAQSICDEKGKRVFNPDDEADIKLLCSQAWKRIQLLLAEPEPGN